MRRDMKHKIVERPRFDGYGNGDAIRQQRAAVRDMDIEELDQLPSKESMRRPHVVNWSQKELNENLNPLYRYLNKQAGRPWNDVYSEICEQIRPDSATQLHILQHVNDIVETHVKIIDGRPYHSNLSGWRSKYGDIPVKSYGRGSYDEMYVDPRDGILKIAPPREKYRRRKPDPDILLSEDRLVQYHRIKGIWYMVTFRDLEDKDYVNRDDEGNLLPERKWKVAVHDILQQSIHFPRMSYGQLPSLREWEWIHHDRIVPINKRQMNSKEIKHLGLNTKKKDAA